MPGQLPLTRRLNLKSLWVAIGGLAGFLAVVIGIAQLGQAVRSEVSGGAVQATMVAILSEQLVVQQAIATTAATGVQVGPTATEDARRIALLVSTQEALEEKRAHLEATLTAGPALAVAPENGQRATSAGGSQAIPTPARALTADNATIELVAVRRFQNTLTVDFEVTNSGREDWHTGRVFGNSYLLDEATHQVYPAFESNDGPFGQAIPPGPKFEVWVKYDLPANANPEYLSLVLRDSSLKIRGIFEHLLIPSM